MQKSLDRMNAVAAVRYQQANTAVFAAAGGGGSNSSVSSKPSDNSTNNNNNNTTAIPVVAPPPPPVLTQSPVLFILPGYEQHQNIPVCFRCGPPAAPDRPYVSFLYELLCLLCANLVVYLNDYYKYMLTTIHSIVVFLIVIIVV